MPAAEPEPLLDAAAVAALRAPAARGSRWWLLVAVLAVLLLALPAVLYVVADGKHSLGGDRLGHLLGRTEQVTARVDAVQHVGYCGRPSESREQFRIELSWTAGPPPGHGGYLVCNSAPGVGENISAWVDADGYVQLESPTEVRLAVAGIGLALALVTIGTGAGILIPPARRRRRLLLTADTPLLPPVPVLAGENRSRKLGFPFRPASPAEGVAPPMWAVPVLHAAPGKAPVPTSLRKLRGQWYFRAGPMLASGRQLGVLERAGERCWVECRALRR